MAIKRLPPPRKKTESEVKASYSEPAYDNRPRLSITETELPAVKDWSVGKEYDLHVKVKMTGSSVSEYGDNKGKITTDFRVVGVGTKE